MTEPAWKRNGRNGPFDWWLACQTHGYEWKRGCLSCMTASDLNDDFAEKLKREAPTRTAYDTRNFPVHDEIPGWENTSQEVREVLTGRSRSIARDASGSPSSERPPAK